MRTLSIILNSCCQRIGKYCLIILFFLIHWFSHAQNNRVIDSLNALLAQNGEDTTAVNTLNLLFKEYILSDPSNAIVYARKGLDLAVNIQYAEGIATSSNNVGYANYQLGDKTLALEYYRKAYLAASEIKNYQTVAVACANIGSYYSAQDNYSKAVTYYEISFEAALADNDSARAAKLLGHIGIAYYNQGSYAKALEKYNKSMKLREQIGDKKGVAYILSNIGIIYDELGNYDKSLEYYQKSFDINREIGDVKTTAGILNNIGEIYYGRKKFKEALSYYEQALNVCEENNLEDIEVDVLNNIGGAYQGQAKYDKALDYLEKTLEIYRKTDNKSGSTSSLNSLGKVKYLQGKYEDALKDFGESLSLAKSTGIKDKEKENYFDISEAYSKMGEYEKAFNYRTRYTQLSDSLLNEEFVRQIADTETKYETEKKEAEIEVLTSEKKLQENEIEKNNILFYSIIIVFVLVVIIALISFYFYRARQNHKQLLIKQEADKVVRASEKQMLAKIIETEEKERKRFAKDLHDGIGPLLSSIKLYVNELAADETEAEERIDMLIYTNELIDDAVKSTRAIANNLMPAVITDYGLVKALKSFCDKMNLTRTVNIKFISNVEGRFDKTAEIMLYRVILELINNTIKHAGSVDISIDLQMEGKEILMKYSDNGRGFDVEATLKDEKRGLGLGNIISRVHSVNGSCEMKSRPGEGYHVDIRVDLNFFGV